MKPADFTVIETTREGLERQGEGFRCCHCGRMHLVAGALQDLILQRPGAVGFCTRCNHPRCAECAECVPEERQIENVEAGRSRLAAAPAFAAFPVNPIIVGR